MRRRDRYQRALVAVIVGLALAALGSSPGGLAGRPPTEGGAEPAHWAPPDAAPAAAAELPQRETARIGVLGIASEVGFYLAQDRGYFAHEGQGFAWFNAGIFEVRQEDDGTWYVFDTVEQVKTHDSYFLTRRAAEAELQAIFNEAAQAGGQAGRKTLVA